MRAEHRTRSYRRLVPAAIAAPLAVTGAALIVVSCGGGRPGEAPASAPSSSPALVRSTAAAVPSPPAPATPSVRRISRPVRLRIPAIGVDTALQPLHRLADGSLQSPNRWQRAGYYADGVLPGGTGPAVIVGHIDSVSGPAVFYRLRNLRRGDSALVGGADGTVLRFVVDRLVSYPKQRFPTNAVYGPTPLPELRLVTCTGDFDWRTHNYLDNLVVYAHLAIDQET